VLPAASGTTTVETKGAMMTSDVRKPRGILHPQAGGKKFRLSLHPPARDLGFFVEHYWIVDWDLRGQEPYLSEILPHPCVHLVIETDKSRIVGVMRGRFSQLLTDKGRVFGIKFRPGAFYPFITSPVSAFTDSSISLRAAFGAEGAALQGAILALEDEGEMVDCAETFLHARCPERDETVGTITRIIDRIIADRDITTVDGLVERLNLNRRTLQRLFSRYVGVGPKWVIRRYRLHEAAERVATCDVVDWPALALDLGYFDQAHFIKDFKAIVGKAPADYAKAIGVVP